MPRCVGEDCILRLTPINASELTLGRLVVCIDAISGKIVPGLRVISSLDPTSLTVATIVAKGQNPLAETMPTLKALPRLRVPIFENGDSVLVHGRRATVVRHAVNELFVALTFDDEPNKEVLANLVHINANELLESFDTEKTQLYAR